jgi:hypothetical protein
VLARLLDPGVLFELGDELLVGEQLDGQVLHAPPMPAEQPAVGVRAGAQPHQVLVRAQGGRLHELGHGDLGVDRAAQREIALPLRPDHVVGRRGRQRDEAHPLQARHQVLERSPPVGTQVVGLVEDDQADPRGPHD